MGVSGYLRPVMRARFLAGLAMLVILAMFAQFAHLATLEARRLAVKREIKHRIKAGVPECERVKFEFTANEVAALDWVKPAKEFRRNGRFYDVVKRIEGEHVVLECIDDHQETELFAHLTDMVDRALDARGVGGESSGKVLLWWKQLTIDHPTIAIPVATEVPATRTTALSSHPLAGCPAVVDHPPKG